MTTNTTGRVDDITRAFGQWVKTAREEAGVTQSRLAVTVGLNHQQMIGKVEHGVRPATISEAYRIAKALGRDLPSIEVTMPSICSACWGTPPAGFTCNACGGGS